MYIGVDFGNGARIPSQNRSVFLQTQIVPPAARYIDPIMILDRERRRAWHTAASRLPNSPAAVQRHPFIVRPPIKRLGPLMLIIEQFRQALQVGDVRSPMPQRAVRQKKHWPVETRENSERTVALASAERDQQR